MEDSFGIEDSYIYYVLTFSKGMLREAYSTD
jgi:hypothetical protein